MEGKIMTAGQTAMESGKEVGKTSSVNSTNTLKVEKSNEGVLKVTTVKSEPPVYVDKAVLIWLFNAVFNFARVTVVPYNTKGKAYLYIIAELDGLVEKQGTYVNDRAVEIVLSLLKGNGINPNDDFFKQEQEVNATDNFQLKLLKRLKDEYKRLYRERDKVRKGVTYFRGYFRFYRGEVRFDMPLTDDVKEFIHERLTINKTDYFNL